MLDNAICSICLSALLEHEAYKDARYTTYDFNCSNCNNYYRQITFDYKEIVEVIERIYFYCAKYCVTNYFIQFANTVNKCVINEYGFGLGINAFNKIELDFRLDFKTLTVDKLKSYIMLV